jgi:hypothetical protein
MSKSSRLAQVAGRPLAAFFLVGLIAVSAGCGGGGDDSVAAAPLAPPGPPAPPPADPIEGIATPSSVAVVTATNAE